MVVEHKGLSDALVFFHSQRVRGQQLHPWDKSASVSDDCPTPGIPTEKAVSKKVSVPLYVTFFFHVTPFSWRPLYVEPNG